MSRTSRRILIVVAAVFAVGFLLALLTAWFCDDWSGLLLNSGTEMAGAAALYYLLERVLEPGERREARKRDLIAQLGSSVHDVAITAAEELRREGWLMDGELRSVNLYRANLQGAPLSEARLENVSLDNANLEGANLLKAHLNGATLRGAHMRDAILSSAHMLGADLVYADLAGALLVETQLQGARLEDADLRGAKLFKADLTKANLMGAKLADANLEAATMDGVLMLGATYNHRTRWPLGFQAPSDTLEVT